MYLCKTFPFPLFSLCLSKIIATQVRPSRNAQTVLQKELRWTISKCCYRMNMYNAESSKMNSIGHL